MKTEFALICRTCGWRPAAGLEMGVVQQHFITEHQTEDVNLDLTPVCPVDDSKLTHRMTGVRRSDSKHVMTYDCPACRRTFRILASPVQEGGS